MAALEYVICVIKPDAMASGKDRDILRQIEAIVEITYCKKLILTERNVHTLYPDKVHENYFPELLDFLTSDVSTLIVAKGPNAGKLMQALKSRIRREVVIKINEEDLILLQQGRHPRQKEITTANALRNLLHVSSEDEGSVGQIREMLGDEYL